MKISIKFSVLLLVIFMLLLFSPVSSLPPTKDQPVTYFSAHKNPEAEINVAIIASANGCKNILLIFGADWCPWCNRLSKFLDEKRKISSVLNDGYRLIKIDIGKWDKNLDLAKKYKVDRKAGIPAIVILDCKGVWLKFQETSVLEEGKGYSEERVLKFLSDNKPKSNILK